MYVWVGHPSRPPQGRAEMLAWRGAEASWLAVARSNAVSTSGVVGYSGPRPRGA